MFCRTTKVASCLFLQNVISRNPLFKTTERYTRLVGEREQQLLPESEFLEPATDVQSLNWKSTLCPMFPRCGENNKSQDMLYTLYHRYSYVAARNNLGADCPSSVVKCFYVAKFRYLSVLLSLIIYQADTNIP